MTAASGSASASRRQDEVGERSPTTPKAPVSEALDQVEVGGELDAEARVDAARDRQHRQEDAERPG